LLPDARPDDGLLDAVVLAPGGLAGWAAVAAHVLRRQASGRIYRTKFAELQVTLDREQPWELDGEVVGPTRQLTIVTQPGSLLLRMPG
jgi:diacylglycerol kinase family enzyme